VDTTIANFFIGHSIDRYKYDKSPWDDPAHFEEQCERLSRALNIVTGELEAKDEEIVKARRETEPKVTKLEHDYLELEGRYREMQETQKTMLKALPNSKVVELLGKGAKIDPALLSQKRGDTDRPVLTPILVGCGLWACPKSTADSTLFDPASVNRDGPLCRHDQRLGALSSHGDSRLQVQGGRHQDQRGVCHGPQRRGRRGLPGLPRPAGSLDRWLDPKDQAREQVIEIPAVPRRLETLIP
jgi:hypothetical protein